MIFELESASSSNKSSLQSQLHRANLRLNEVQTNIREEQAIRKMLEDLEMLNVSNSQQSPPTNSENQLQSSGKISHDMKIIRQHFVKSRPQNHKQRSFSNFTKQRNWPRSQIIVIKETIKNQAQWPKIDPQGGIQWLQKTKRQYNDRNYSLQYQENSRKEMARQCYFKSKRQRELQLEQERKKIRSELEAQMGSQIPKENNYFRFEGAVYNQYYNNIIERQLPDSKNKKLGFFQKALQKCQRRCDKTILQINHFRRLQQSYSNL